LKVNIENKKENLLFGRTDINFSVKEAQATPPREAIRKQIAALTNSKEEMVVVGVLDTSYGTTDLKGQARVYKNKKSMEKTELKYVVTRNFGKEKPVEAKKEDAPAEKTAEEKNEEPKEESKKE